MNIELTRDGVRLDNDAVDKFYLVKNGTDHFRIMKDRPLGEWRRKDITPLEQLIKDVELKSYEVNGDFVVNMGWVRTGGKLILAMTEESYLLLVEAMK